MGPLMADGLDDAFRGVIRDEMAPLTEQVRLLTEQVTTLPREVGFPGVRAVRVLICSAGQHSAVWTARRDRGLRCGVQWTA